MNKKLENQAKPPSPKPPKPTATATPTPQAQTTKTICIKNLPRFMKKDNIEGLLREQNLLYSKVKLNHGHAYVECRDRMNIELALKKLEGVFFHGKILHVKPVVGKEETESPPKSATGSK